jgi:hypothetical protein
MSLALLIVTTLYFLCSITLTLMLPYTLISPDAAFSQVLPNTAPAHCTPDSWQSVPPAELQPLCSIFLACSLQLMHGN